MKCSELSFEHLGLSKNILRGVYAHGFTSPSPIQCEAIPAIVLGKDTVVQSKNGTGKTATFLLALLQRLGDGGEGVQGLILSPTRDLALQTFSVFDSLAKFSKIKGHCAVGGHSASADMKAVETNCGVVCGTPGRVLQLLRERPKSFAGTKMVVLDEADRVLDNGFGTQVKSIFDALKESAPQLVIVSATLPGAVKEMLSSLLKTPQMFLVPQDKLSVDRIAQYYAEVKKQTDKFEALCDVFGTFSISQAVIFANNKEGVSDLEKTMKMHEFSVTAIHSGLEQLERDKRLEGFFSGKHRVLISTDVMSRGIDAAHVNLVVNYDIPLSSEEYLHRIGRGGRFGKSSIAVTLVAPNEKDRAQTICGAFGKKLQPLILGATPVHPVLDQ
ncbi:ATP-dependent RNA helicase [Nematocida displodere]|uniref:RNA helicase n=1 Tax=Nematocida displodere TaxID=1805483 RepID=A0A177EA80_9MICR|nr:ATP-dependent RNA helicase [Nematocida displodere]